MEGKLRRHEEVLGKGVHKVHQSSREIGLRGEDIAAEYFEALGLPIVSRNYRSRFGEIDLVAKDGDTIVFVEVKARRSRQLGTAVEQITKGKQRRIIRAACDYLRRCGALASYVRFDVLAIDMLPGGEARIEHLKGAFNSWR
jgi:putative endonuclease